MAKTTGRLVRVKLTSGNITRGIINYLTVKGHLAFRIQSTGLWDPVKKQFRQSGSKKGVADIICCYGGKFLAIEVKNEKTHDRIRPDQITFSRDVAAAGGIYIIARSYKAFTDWYESQELQKEGVTL
jgi:Holliday junction resolvase